MSAVRDKGQLGSVTGLIVEFSPRELRRRETF
jgi:hypothetical protein